jgi:hypothetical protein
MKSTDGPLEKKIVVLHDCESAEAFLDALSPWGPIFGDFSPAVWVFRGHQDDCSECENVDSEVLNRLHAFSLTKVLDLTESASVSPEN